MKIQGVAVIFGILMIPVSLVLSAYIQIQIDALSIQIQYDTALYDATYDALQAFEINTTTNAFSNISDSIRRDIKASTNALVTSLATNLGVGGYTDKYIMPYLPAVLYTLYDGYYIYSPAYDEVNDIYTNMLKPYIYYSERYAFADIDVTVNFTLDNYIVVYGNINGKYNTKAGYLVVPGDIEIRQNGNKMTDYKLADYSDDQLDAMVENGEITIKYKGLSIQDKDAIKYYAKAKKFTNWVNSTIGLVQANESYKEGERDTFFNNSDEIFYISSSNDPEDELSNFNGHKKDVIRNSIEDNLLSAIARYNERVDKTYNYKMPLIDEKEWETITTNVNIVVFMQGMPAGTRFYNNYVVMTSILNEEFTNKNEIYYLDEAIGDNVINYYHRIDCPHLTGGDIQGYKSTEFTWMEMEDPITSAADNIIENRLFIHKLGCYHCIVNNLYDKQETLNSARQLAYYTAIARNRNNSYKINTYLNLEFD